MNDLTAANIIKDLNDEQALGIMKIFKCDAPLAELRELAKTPDLNLVIASEQNQNIIDQFDGRQPVNIQTRYLLTDQALVSPSGFHPSEHVFLMNDVMIQTDRLPRNTNLKCYDMTLITE